MAVLRFLNRYLIHVERACSGPIKSKPRLRVRPLRGNFRGSRLCQVRLILDDEIIGGKSDVKSRLFHIYGFELNNR